MAYGADGKPHYISRSWDMLTRDKGWIKVILLLALASFVPFVGLIGLVGYGLEWARLTAWGIDSSPKQRGVRIGECLASGWRALVVTFVWMFVWMLAAGIVNSIADVLLPDALASLIGSLLVLAQLFYILVVYVAVLRAAIYTKISAGLNPSRVLEMVKRAPGDLFFFVLIPIVGGLIASAIWIFFMLLGGVSVLPEIIKMARAATGSFDDAMFIRHLTAMLRIVMPIAAIAGYLSSVVNAATSLLSYNAVGLWMRQFDVARWGGPSDPLPHAASLPASTVPPTTPGAGGGYPAQQPPVTYAPPANQSYQAPAAQPYQQATSQPYQAPAGQACQQTTAPATVPVPSPQDPEASMPASAQMGAAPAQVPMPTQAPAPTAASTNVTPAPTAAPETEAQPSDEVIVPLVRPRAEERTGGSESSPTDNPNNPSQQ
ncbi:DUF4013 domain-containing protein [uncultured Parolsenella sp.]|uniref:DUF4013 domain-containing protein n=1 Tax=uncultured Parolsenella sp. TaxID=2083008 RepID=UPI0025E96A08|nr:DUF4013 domain-containing protein [uncultured Parolsenella sp.]